MDRNKGGSMKINRWLVSLVCGLVMTLSGCAITNETTLLGTR